MRLRILKSSLLAAALVAAVGTSFLAAEQADQQHRTKPSKIKVLETKSVTPGQNVPLKKFQVTASEGKIAPSTLRVKKGERVRVTFVSRDGSYGVKFKDFDVKEKVTPEKPAVVDFTPGQSGTFEFRCTRIWGFKHWSNNGTLVVE